MFYVMDSIKTFQNGKAEGLDGVAAEMLKALPWSAILRLRQGFELRLNNLAGGEVYEDWHSILVHCIPKLGSPTSLSHWRPISLLSCVQKLYACCIMKVLDDHFVWPPELVGFTSGRQTMEVTFAARLALAKSVEWGTGCFIAKLDIRKAFDSIDHQEFARCCVDLGLPALLTLAMLRELASGVCSINVQGFGADDVLMLGGGKQGGRDTPKIWNLHLWGIIRDLVASWRSRGVVWAPDSSVSLSIQIWADDIVIYADCL